MNLLKSVKKRSQRARGWNLVELALYTAIVAIILTWAIGQMVGLSARATDRGAQSSARVAITAARVAVIDSNDNFLDSTFSLSNVASEERSIKILADGTGSTGKNEVSMAKDATDNAVYAAVKGNRRCWYQRKQLSMGTLGAGDLTGDRYAVTPVPDNGTCEAPSSPGTLNWKTEWPSR